jgi:sulfite reductase (NADPH) hemoprotein beta-component
MSEEKKLSANEYIKIRSNHLRGTIAEGLADTSTGSMAEDDQQLLKFHGTYQQDDRDLRADRRRNKLEKAYSFMIRIRVPGGGGTTAKGPEKGHPLLRSGWRRTASRCNTRITQSS